MDAPPGSAGGWNSIRSEHEVERLTERALASVVRSHEQCGTVELEVRGFAGAEVRDIELDDLRSSSAPPWRKGELNA